MYDECGRNVVFRRVDFSCCDSTILSLPRGSAGPKCLKPSFQGDDSCHPRGLSGVISQSDPVLESLDP